MAQEHARITADTWMHESVKINFIYVGYRAKPVYREYRLEPAISHKVVVRDCNFLLGDDVFDSAGHKRDIQSTCSI